MAVTGSDHGQDLTTRDRHDHPLIDHPGLRPVNVSAGQRIAIEDGDRANDSAADVIYVGTQRHVTEGDFG